MTTTPAGEVQQGQRIRVEHGPKAGHTGTVESVTVCDRQMGTLMRTAIIDFTDGSRSVRPAGEAVTVVDLAAIEARAQAELVDLLDRMVEAPQDPTGVDCFERWDGIDA